MPTLPESMRIRSPTLPATAGTSSPRQRLAEPREDEPRAVAREWRPAYVPMRAIRVKLGRGAVAHHAGRASFAPDLEVDPGEVVRVVGLDKPVLRVGGRPEAVAAGGQAGDVDPLVGQIPVVGVAPTHREAHPPREARGPP